VKRLCVFCGSAFGADVAYRAAAEALGRALTLRNIGVVYGGGHTGLMGAVADAALAAGGQVIGVIPQSLVDREIAHRGLTELHVVGSLHERKALMAELSQAFVALPGGFGTLDEFCEVVTWRQLGLHGKPCALLNTSAYFDPFLATLAHAQREGFIASSTIDRLIVENDVEALLDALAAHP
jgi:uncharacterized protein (TIGR00730 family)